MTTRKRRTRVRGRPVQRKYPPRIDASPEAIARAVLSAKPGPVTKAKVYRCEACNEAVYYPDTLYQDGRCEACHE